MKIALSLLFLFTSISIFTSCGGDEEEPANTETTEVSGDTFEVIYEVTSSTGNGIALSYQDPNALIAHNRDATKAPDATTQYDNATGVWTKTFSVSLNKDENIYLEFNAVPEKEVATLTLKIKVNGSVKNEKSVANGSIGYNLKNPS